MIQFTSQIATEKYIYKKTQKKEKKRKDNNNAEKEMKLY